MTEDRAREIVHEVLAKKTHSSVVDLCGDDFAQEVRDAIDKPWPPAGMVVLVQWYENCDWFYAESRGDGFFSNGSPGSAWQNHMHAWKYIPANWDNAPQWAQQWVVVSTGEQQWMHPEYEVGDEFYNNGATVVYVEDRP